MKQHTNSYCEKMNSQLDRLPAKSGRSGPLGQRARQSGRKRLRALLTLELIAGLGLIPAGSAMAQTFTTLHNFAGDDGTGPNALVTDSLGNTLYGTANSGGISGKGTVFAVPTDGTGFTNLHSFTATACYDCPNSDGAWPEAGPILSGNTLYGTASYGGTSGQGTVFKVSTDGTGFATLHSFTGTSDGAVLLAGLISSGNTLYGAARDGGSAGSGTVFRLDTDGSGFTNLYSFTAIAGYPSTNSDGAEPLAGLVLSSNTLYGTAYYGGTSGNGTVFAVNSDGTGFRTLHSFTSIPAYPAPQTNGDGALPQAGLILSGSTLYGATSGGGSAGGGAVFAVQTDGTGFTNLHSFPALPPYPNNTNRDGTAPRAGLILSGNTLFGTAYAGGSSSRGTVFAVNTDGTSFTVLHNFTGGSDGAGPFGVLVLSGNALYGTTSSGGSSGSGTVFSLSFLPQLSITGLGTNVALSWPVSYAGFDYTGYVLESTASLSPAAPWVTNSAVPVVIGGQLTVTNPITGTQQFYRLVQ